MLSKAQYTVRRVEVAPPLESGPDHPAWATAEVADVACFYRDSTHRPHTNVRMLHDRHCLYVQFNVMDQYVRAVETEYQGNICHDSCVEFFVQPRAGGGYFNLEVNCGGTMMLMYIEDPRWLGGRLRRFCSVWPEHAGNIRIHHTLPKVIEQEITDPVSWRVSLAVPVSILEPYVGPLGALNGTPWRGNFYKCADKCSHPHWASWAPMNGVVNFHQPQYFGALHFEP